MDGEIVSAELAEILLEDRIDALDADRLARSVIALHAEVARLQKLLDENIEDRVRAHEILGCAEYETTAEAAARVVNDEVSASVEAGRLLAILEGRTTPPTDAELAAHEATSCGWWLVATEDTFEHEMLTPPERDSWERAGAERWWPLADDGRPCAWPAGTGTP